MYSKNSNNYIKERKKYSDELSKVLGQGKFTGLKVGVRAKAN